MVLQKENYQIVLALLRNNLILRVSDDTLLSLSVWRFDESSNTYLLPRNSKNSLKKGKVFPQANNYFEILAYVFK